MEISSDITVTQKPPSDEFLNPEQFLLFAQVLSSICILISTCGVIANIINVTAFIRLDVRDGFTFTFLVLSVTDLSFSLLNLVNGVTTWMSIAESLLDIQFPTDPFAIAVISGTTSGMIYAHTVLNTTFAAVVRCLIVVRPLQFRNAFRRKTSGLVLVGLCLVAVACYGPLLGSMSVGEEVTSMNDSTRITLRYSDDRPALRSVSNVFGSLILPISTETIAGACVVIFIGHLRTASGFRQRVTRGNNKTQDGQGEDASVFRLKGKDLKTAQQVYLITWVYVVCNSPKTVMAVAYLAEPEFDLDRKYKMIYMLASGIEILFELTNASVNILIYIKFNTKFRRIVCD